MKPKWTPLAYKFETKQRIKKRVLRRAQREWFKCKLEQRFYNYYRAFAEWGLMTLEDIRANLADFMKSSMSQEKLRPSWDNGIPMKVYKA